MHNGYPDMTFGRAARPPETALEPGPENVHPERLRALISRCVERLELDLGGLVVVTEAGTNHFALTPVIAAYAGAARVYAVSRDSRWGEAAAAHGTVERLRRTLGAPDRIEAVRQHMHARIEQLGVSPTQMASAEVAGSFSRLWGNVLDVFVSLFPLVIYIGFRMISASSGGGRGGGSARRGRGGSRGGRGGSQEPEATWQDQAIDYVTSPEAVWETVEVYGPWVLGFLAYRALFTLPQLVRSGSTPGMREAGVRVESTSGKAITWRQVFIRHVTAYVLGFVTLGVSHLWSFGDRQGRTLFDRIAGTRVVRMPRRWEKPEAQRLLED